ncbi:MAG: hypothetical protein QOJ51_386, partial [Acidobacteriaceae bacterium]|nr:hypothetical protein [Acidobacteriaceae bacterium]
GDRFEVAKEATRAVVGAGREIEFCGWRGGGIVAARGSAIAGADGPEAVDGERFSSRILHQADEFTAGEIVGGNGAAALRGAAPSELADKQSMAEGAEVERGEGNAPWRVEPVAVFETLKELATGGEDIDVTEAWAIGFERIAFLVKDEGDDYVVTDRLDIEGYEVTRKTIVCKGLVVVVVAVPISVVV